MLCVWAPDRLTREGTLRTLEIVRDFGRAGVPVISCQEGWTEQAGPVQELLLAIAGWAAPLGVGTASRAAEAATSPGRSGPGRSVPGAKQRDWPAEGRWRSHRRSWKAGQTSEGLWAWISHMPFRR